MKDYRTLYEKAELRLAKQKQVIYDLDHKVSVLRAKLLAKEEKSNYHQALIKIDQLQETIKDLENMRTFWEQKYEKLLRESLAGDKSSV